MTHSLEASKSEKMPIFMAQTQGRGIDLLKSSPAHSLAAWFAQAAAMIPHLTLSSHLPPCFKPPTPARRPMPIRLRRIAAAPGGLWPPTHSRPGRRPLDVSSPRPTSAALSCASPVAVAAVPPAPDDIAAGKALAREGLANAMSVGRGEERGALLVESMASCR